MVDSYLSNSVPKATPAQLRFEIERNKSLVILDSREEAEYQASHIENSVFVGHDNFNISSLTGLPKNSKIYVYCSIGYRSEEIGEKLIAAGYTKVYNVYGGIFSWVNAGYEVVDTKGKPTSQVHGYSKKWAKWLNKKRASVVLN